MKLFLGTAQSAIGVIALSKNASLIFRIIHRYTVVPIVFIVICIFSKVCFTPSLYNNGACQLYLYNQVMQVDHNRIAMGGQLPIFGYLGAKFQFFKSNK